MRKHLTFAAALIASAGFAQAQQQDTTADPATATGTLPVYIEVEDEAATVGAFGLAVGEVENADIYGPTGERVAEIEEVLVNPQGEIVAVSAEVGGFVGIGDREVIVELGQLRREGDRFVTSLTQQQLEALPAWDD